MAWGHHLLLNLKNCRHLTIRCPNHILQFTKHLIRDIDMVAYGDPILKHFGTGNKAGYTLVQLIETSNITAHFVEETNDAYLDIFSCKSFEPKKVELLIDQYFLPDKVSSIFLQRLA